MTPVASACARCRRPVPTLAEGPFMGMCVSCRNEIESRAREIGALAGSKDSGDDQNPAATKKPPKLWYDFLERLVCYRDLFMIVGGLCVGSGLFWIYPPLALLWAGVCFIQVARLMAH